METYFKQLGERVELNRCFTCNVGMVFDTPTDRYCPKCGYSDSSNVPFKAKIRFSIFEDIPTKTKGMVIVVATETIPPYQISFTKQFVDGFIAQRYIDKLSVVCL